MGPVTRTAGTVACSWLKALAVNGAGYPANVGGLIWVSLLQLKSITNGMSYLAPNLKCLRQISSSWVQWYSW